MNNKLSILLSFLLPLFIHPSLVSSQIHEKQSHCIEGNYTANSTYQANLAPIVGYLTNQSSKSNYANYSIGTGLDKVNMFYMCRGYLTSARCSNCIETIVQRAESVCPNSIGVIFWDQECMLRYSSVPIFSIEDERYFAWDYSLGNVSNPLPYDEVVVKTMDGLIMDAAYNKSKKGYAVGEGDVSGLLPGSDTVYCFVQCTPDILGRRCERCLRAALRGVGGCCGVSKTSVQFYLPSCQIHYDTLNFINGSFSSLSLPPAPPANGGSATTMKNSDGNMFVVGFIVAICILFSFPLN